MKIAKRVKEWVLATLGVLGVMAVAMAYISAFTQYMDVAHPPTQHLQNSTRIEATPQEDGRMEALKPGFLLNVSRAEGIPQGDGMKIWAQAEQAARWTCEPPQFQIRLCWYTPQAEDLPMCK